MNKQEKKGWTGIRTKMFGLVFLVLSLVCSDVLSEAWKGFLKDGEVYAYGCVDTSTGKWKSTCKDTTSNDSVNNMVKNGITLFLGVVGTVAIIMVIYGGFLYVTSAGDAGKVKQARNTVLYGVIGLMIALLAFAIVSFVTDKLISARTDTKTSISTLAATPPSGP